MSETDDLAVKFDKLRKQAEELIQTRPDLSADAPGDIMELIHELKIHQVELHLQNEELQRAQGELTELHREFRNLYELAPCGYITLDENGLITRANLTAVEMLGGNRQHLIGSGFRQFIVKYGNELYSAARDSFLKTSEKQSFEIELKTAAKSTLWVRVELEADFFPDDTGNIIEWRLVLLDISERVTLDEALRQSEEKYRSMMEAITDPVYVCSALYHIEYLNRAMIKRLGRDATGETCYQALHGLDEFCDWCPFEEVRQGRTKEHVIKSPLDNHTYRLTHMPVRNSDGTISKLTMYRDITDYLDTLQKKEQVEAELIQAQKLESIGNLAGGIAHDFNNILSSIVGFAELALEDTVKGSHQQKDLEEIYRGGMRAKELVTQILTFARKTNEEVKPVNVKNIITESLGFLRSSIPTNLTIKHYLDSESNVVGNPALLQQVVINLVTNAADAMEGDGGRIEIACEDIVIDEDTAAENGLLGAGNYVRIAISDNGSGIDPDILEQIFEPYFTTKEIGRGTGMGLATVHGTIKKYGGSISVESQQGQGTVFSVLLPASKSDYEIKPHHSDMLPGGAEHILVVDDDASIVKLTTLVLERLGYKVTARTNSIEALELFKAAPDDFDLVLSDMTMPNLCGDKLTIELIKVRQNIPVILCTGFSQDLSEDSAVEMGVRAFVYKPLRKADLAQIVRRVLDDCNTDQS